MRAIDIVRYRKARARRANGRGRRLLHVATVIGLSALLALVLIPAAGIAVGAAGLLTFVRDLPDVAPLEQLPVTFQPSIATTRLYAWDEPGAHGLRRPVLIDEIADPRLSGAGWARLEDLPPFIAGALTAAEDPQFMTAAPVDLASTLAEWRQTGAVDMTQSPITRRAIETHLRAEIAQPGDTRRALQDWLLGRQIEHRYTREQILEWDLNTRYYGNLAYGIEAAARVYFGKSAADLTPGEAAMLTAVAYDPAANPFDDPAAAEHGQAAVLGALAAMNVITPDEAAIALETPLALAPPPGSDSPVPEFARLARRELEAILGPDRLLRGGWQVETTLDPALQTQAICVTAAHVARLSGLSAPSGGGPSCPAREFLPDTNEEPAGGESLDIAIVALNPITGEIEALTGEATDAPRPIGSLVRPLIYLTALSQGHTAATLTMDTASTYLSAGQPYTPDNADGQYRGPLRLREALVATRAVPAAQALSWVGVARVRATARALGLAPDEAETPSDLSFADQGFPATLLELSHAYATIDQGGTATGTAMGGTPRPATIRRILDPRGEEVYAYEPATRETLAPELAYLLTDMLADGETRCATLGCPNTLELPDGRRAAVATGESAAGDAWAVGYTPERLIGVQASGEGAAGYVDAAPLWRALMAWSTAGTPAGDWQRPAGLRSVQVCEMSGLLPSRDARCPTVSEWFAPGTEPTAPDTMTREVAVNRETGRLATIFTPPRLIERRTYIIYPPEVAAWAVEAGVEAPPTEYDTIRRVPTRNDGAAITSPEPFAVVSGQWSVVGSAGGDALAYYRLAYFPGLMPEAMQTLVERGETPVESAELGVWDTTLLEEGLYTLLLTVVRQDGTFADIAIPVTVANED